MSRRRSADLTVAWLSRLIGVAWIGILARVTVQLLHADRLYGDVPYAYASVAPPGALVFTAGACPLDENGVVVGEGDVRLQARQAVANLTEALAAAGSGLTDVLKTTVYVASGDRGDLVAVWDVVRAAFADHDAPSTLLGVAALGYAGQLVEIEAVALSGLAGGAGG
jgi:enamine deaminase RidA (YjgF/YER057c/UK114 family)